ncbi:unnamed protein product [Microthlaspi erraticum]|uniref:Retrotransposon gag domain-containing protein n=1 Tax=Microthlaspi erraticum TaxID=1685480 RepID=A0A6D2JI78_9BRAS|nr:unnamed protein product [Microthlaspi erraticum]
MFHGLPSEDPIDHLDEFDRLCDLTKINGVSEDAIKLRLFPMSLADKAHQWEKSLPHGTITTWDECKKAFLAKFFSTGRTAKLRGEISSFIQRNNETFAEAWERFKGYTSQCPHHGFNNESLLSTLYRGCLPRYREMLDTASNGNFLNQDVDDGWQLVENMAISTECYGEHYESTDWSSTAHSIELDAQMRKTCLHSTRRRGGDNTRVCYIQNRQGSYRNPQQGRYNNYQAPWPHQQQSVPQGFNTRTTHTQPTQDWDMKEMLQQLLQGQAKGSLEMNNKLVEIHSKLESLTSRVQIIEGSPPQIAVDIDDEEGEDLVDYADNSTRTRSSWNKTLNQNSIELEKLRHCKTNQSSIEQKRTDKASSSQPAKPVAKKKDTPAGPPPYKAPSALSRKVQETTVGSTQGQV